MRTPIAKVTPEIGRAKCVGFVHEVRDLGGLTFVLLRDRTGILQVTVPKKKVPPEVAEAVRSVSRESVVMVTGEIKATEKAPGGRELVPSSFEVLSRAETPLPLDVAEKVPAELDTRLDVRFLDARRPRIAAIFQVRSAVLHETSRYLHKHDFIQITTPKIVAAATEGGTELFPIAYF
ncbi:MAG TPA: aspartate--tRNA(Asn) ligase, partial [Methanoregulaceae archaeon]|nr:aspartate--tRNA(Asn) ligase [Methanoregulaceae archaeon]